MTTASPIIDVYHTDMCSYDPRKKELAVSLSHDGDYLAVAPESGTIVVRFMKLKSPEAYSVDYVVSWRVKFTKLAVLHVKNVSGTDEVGGTYWISIVAIKDVAPPSDLYSVKASWMRKNYCPLGLLAPLRFKVLYYDSKTAYKEYTGGTPSGAVYEVTV